MTLEFVREILEYVASHREEVLSIHESSRERTAARGRDPEPDDLVGIRHRPAAFTEPALIRGYVGETDEPAEHRVVHVGRFEPTLSVRRPAAYVLAPETPEVVLENLALHGVTVEPSGGRLRSRSTTCRRSSAPSARSRATT